MGDHQAITVHKVGFERVPQAVCTLHDAVERIQPQLQDERTRKASVVVKGSPDERRRDILAGGVAGEAGADDASRRALDGLLVGVGDGRSIERSGQQVCAKVVFLEYRVDDIPSGSTRKRS